MLTDGIPSQYKFWHKISDWRGVPDKVFSMALKFSGFYRLHGFGRYEGMELKMASELDGLHGLTPVWRKNTYTNNDMRTEFFIFFNQRSEKWELHEKHSWGSSTHFEDHLICEAGCILPFSF